MSISFLLDQKPIVFAVGSARERSASARSIRDCLIRSNSERVARPACVGKQFWLLGSIPHVMPRDDHGWRASPTCCRAQTHPSRQRAVARKHCTDNGRGATW